jgi:lysophospholipase L1-like esterase
MYSEGKLFEKYDNFFKYHPNLNKRYLQFYFHQGKFKKIWDYNFPTNNFGLVQSNNIYENKKSILFLGDSFTEGQGAEPWIDKFGKNFLDYQIINGGIIGTGFQQFEKIHDHIKNTYNVEKVVIIYIGSDLRRGIELAYTTDCLRNNNYCKKDASVFSIPNKESEIENFLIKKHKLRQEKKLSLKNKMKYLVRETYTYNILRNYINTIRLKDDSLIKANFQAIDNLLKKNEKNLILINIKTAQEIMKNQESYETELIRKHLEKKKILNYQCDMNNDINNFHQIDFHPNKNGYDEIFNCVKKILDSNFK